MSSLTPYQCVKSFVHANIVIGVGETVQLNQAQATYLITSGFIELAEKSAESSEQIKQSKPTPKAKETNHE
ncbi:MAG TPA: hypothetical protein PLF09_07970 [Thiotrichales bacterium]|jgi:hypothetical protein|nr:hypothetical protein [Thiotrichales bacterium]